MAQTLDSNGNVVANGYSTNLTPAQLPQAINASSLQTPQASIQTAQPNYDISKYMNVANSSQAYNTSSATEAQAQADATAKANELASANTDISRLASSLNGQGTGLATSTVNEALNATGANDKLSILNRLNAESLGINYAKDMIPLQLQNQATGQGITDRGLAPIQTKMLRDNAIQLASNAYQAAIAKADYDTAKSKSDAIIALKYDGVMAELNAKKTNIENIKSSLTSAEKKVAEATAQRLEAEKLATQNKMEEEKAISDVGMTLRKYGVSDSVVKDVLSSKNLNDAILKAGNNLQDPKAKLELLNLKTEIALKQAQTRKAERDSLLTTEPSEKEKKATVLAIAQAKASAQAAQEKIDSIDALLSLDTGISARVGTTALTRGIVGPAIGGAVVGLGAGPVGAVVGGLAGSAKGISSAFSGQGQQVSGAVHRITHGLTLDKLIEAKKNGATFGGLTIPELTMLAASATELNDWEIKDDKGNPTGYWNVDEKTFRAKVKEIQDFSRKAILQSQGTLIAPDESLELDSLFTPEEPTASQYY